MSEGQEVEREEQPKAAVEKLPVQPDSRNLNVPAAHAFWTSSDLERSAVIEICTAIVRRVDQTLAVSDQRLSEVITMDGVEIAKTSKQLGYENLNFTQKLRARKEISEQSLNADKNKAFKVDIKELKRVISQKEKELDLPIEHSFWNRSDKDQGIIAKACADVVKIDENNKSPQQKVQEIINAKDKAYSTYGDTIIQALDSLKKNNLDYDALPFGQQVYLLDVIRSKVNEAHKANIPLKLESEIIKQAYEDKIKTERDGRKVQVITDAETAINNVLRPMINDFNSEGEIGKGVLNDVELRGELASILNDKYNEIEYGVTDDLRDQSKETIPTKFNPAMSKKPIISEIQDKFDQDRSRINERVKPESLKLEVRKVMSPQIMSPALGIINMNIGGDIMPPLKEQVIATLNQLPLEENASYLTKVKADGTRTYSGIDRSTIFTDAIGQKVEEVYGKDSEAIKKNLANPDKAKELQNKVGATLAALSTVTEVIKNIGQETGREINESTCNKIYNNLVDNLATELGEEYLNAHKTDIAKDLAQEIRKQKGQNAIRSDFHIETKKLQGVATKIIEHHKAQKEAEAEAVKEAETIIATANNDRQSNEVPRGLKILNENNFLKDEVASKSFKQDLTKLILDNPKDTPDRRQKISALALKSLNSPEMQAYNIFEQAVGKEYQGGLSDRGADYLKENRNEIIEGLITITKSSSVGPQRDAKVRELANELFFKGHAKHAMHSVIDGIKISDYASLAGEKVTEQLKAELIDIAKNSKGNDDQFDLEIFNQNVAKNFEKHAPKAKAYATLNEAIKKGKYDPKKFENLREKIEPQLTKILEAPQSQERDKQIEQLLVDTFNQSVGVNTRVAKAIEALKDVTQRSTEPNKEYFNLANTQTKLAAGIEEVMKTTLPGKNLRDKINAVYNKVYLEPVAEANKQLENALGNSTDPINSIANHLNKQPQKRAQFIAKLAEINSNTEDNQRGARVAELVTNYKKEQAGELLKAALISTGKSKEIGGHEREYIKQELVSNDQWSSFESVADIADTIKAPNEDHKKARIQDWAERALTDYIKKETGQGGVNLSETEKSDIIQQLVAKYSADMPKDYNKKASLGDVTHIVQGGSKDVAQELWFSAADKSLSERESAVVGGKSPELARPESTQEKQVQPLESVTVATPEKPAPNVPRSAAVENGVSSVSDAPKKTEDSVTDKVGKAIAVYKLTHDRHIGENERKWLEEQVQTAQKQNKPMVAGQLLPYLEDNLSPALSEELITQIKMVREADKIELWANKAVKDYVDVRKDVPKDVQNFLKQEMVIKFTEQYANNKLPENINQPLSSTTKDEVVQKNDRPDESLILDSEKAKFSRSSSQSSLDSQQSAQTAVQEPAKSSQSFLGRVFNRKSEKPAQSPYNASEIESYIQNLVASIQVKDQRETQNQTTAETVVASSNIEQNQSQAHIAETEFNPDNIIGNLGIDIEVPEDDHSLDSPISQQYTLSSSQSSLDSQQSAQTAVQEPAKSSQSWLGRVFNRKSEKTAPSPATPPSSNTGQASTLGFFAKLRNLVNPKPLNDLSAIPDSTRRFSVEEHQDQMPGRASWIEQTIQQVNKQAEQYLNNDRGDGVGEHEAEAVETVIPEPQENMDRVLSQLNRVSDSLGRPLGSSPPEYYDEDGLSLSESGLEASIARDDVDRDQDIDNRQKEIEQDSQNQDQEVLDPSDAPGSSVEEELELSVSSSQSSLDSPQPVQITLQEPAKSSQSWFGRLVNRKSEKTAQSSATPKSSNSSPASSVGSKPSFFAWVIHRVTGKPLPAEVMSSRLSIDKGQSDDKGQSEKSLIEEATGTLYDHFKTNHDIEISSVGDQDFTPVNREIFEEGQLDPIYEDEEDVLNKAGNQEIENLTQEIQDAAVMTLHDDHRSVTDQEVASLTDDVDVELTDVQVQSKPLMKQEPTRSSKSLKEAEKALSEQLKHKGKSSEQGQQLSFGERVLNLFRPKPVIKAALASKERNRQINELFGNRGYEEYEPLPELEPVNEVNNGPILAMPESAQEKQVQSSVASIEMHPVTPPAQPSVPSPTKDTSIPPQAAKSTLSERFSASVRSFFQKKEKLKDKEVVPASRSNSLQKMEAMSGPSVNFAPKELDPPHKKVSAAEIVENYAKSQPNKMIGKYQKDYLISEVAKGDQEIGKIVNDKSNPSLREARIKDVADKYIDKYQKQEGQVNKDFIPIGPNERSYIVNAMAAAPLMLNKENVFLDIRYIRLNVEKNQALQKAQKLDQAERVEQLAAQDASSRSADVSLENEIPPAPEIPRTASVSPISKPDASVSPTVQGSQDKPELNSVQHEQQQKRAERSAEASESQSKVNPQPVPESEAVSTPAPEQQQVEPPSADGDPQKPEEPAVPAPNKNPQTVEPESVDPKDKQKESAVPPLNDQQLKDKEELEKQKRDVRAVSVDPKDANEFSRQLADPNKKAEVRDAIWEKYKDSPNMDIEAVTNQIPAANFENISSGKTLSGPLTYESLKGKGTTSTINFAVCETPPQVVIDTTSKPDPKLSQVVYIARVKPNGEKYDDNDKEGHDIIIFEKGRIVGKIEGTKGDSRLIQDFDEIIKQNKQQVQGVPKRSSLGVSAVETPNIDEIRQKAEQQPQANANPSPGIPVPPPILSGNNAQRGDSQADSVPNAKDRAASIQNALTNSNGNNQSMNSASPASPNDQQKRKGNQENTPQTPVSNKESGNFWNMTMQDRIAAFNKNNTNNKSDSHNVSPTDQITPPPKVGSGQVNGVKR